MRRKWIELLAIGLMLSPAVWSQEQQAQEEDGPGQGVARVSLINGDVSVRRGDSGDYVAAALNAPVLAQDSVVTGPNSRSELQFDWANMLRLGPDTEIRVSDLDNNRFQAQLARGTVTMRQLQDSEADFEVDTTSVSVRPTKKGMYRITVREDGQIEITVRSGEVDVFSPRGVEHLRSGRTMLVRGNPGDPEFQIVRAIDQDYFDRWNDERDHYLDRSRSYQYVSRDIYGAYDLDNYGRWINVPPYGWVWSPSGVAYDWAPYRYGRWSWMDYYGWSWVSYDPWGWAPYHYGRWFNQPGYGWCWFPGPMHQRHYWRPALVGFFGWGGGGIGVGFGNVGWVPLAPYETYHPWYGRGWYGHRANVTNITVVNNVNITNVYRNARISNAVSGVDANGFARGGRAAAVHSGEFQQARLVRGGPLPVTPGAESLRVSNREARVTGSARNVANERFYSRRPATNVERVPFEQQRQNVDQAVRRSMGNEGGVAQRPGSVSGGMPAARGGQAGWRQSETPAVRANPQVERGNVERGNADRGLNSNNSGWRRMGERDSNSGPAVVDRGRSTPQNSGRYNEAPRGNTSRPEVQRQETPQNNNRYYEAPRRENSRPEVQQRQETPQNNPRYNEAPRRETARPEVQQRQETPRTDRYYAPRNESQQRIQINPPIVRERSTPAPRSEAPRYEAPRSAPAPRYEAPRSSGGGGGGGRMESHSGGGGGGGARGGGGGGRR